MASLRTSASRSKYPLFWATIIYGIVVVLCSTHGSAHAAPVATPAAAPQSFSVTVTGKGAPMLLIPGLTCSGDVWRETVEHYKTSYECHVVTLAGFAGQPPIAFSDQKRLLATVKNDLIAYIRTQKFVKPVIVGHSLGGFLALWIGAEAPELAGKLVIVDALPFLPGAMMPNATLESAKPIAEQMRSMIADQPLESYKTFQRTSPALKSMITDPKNLAIAAEWGANSDPKTVGQAMYDMYQTDLRSDMARITAPALIFGTWIGYKPYATREGVEANFKAQYTLLPNHTLVITDKARHFVMWDDKEGFLSAVDNFLGRSTSAR